MLHLYYNTIGLQVKLESGKFRKLDKVFFGCIVTSMNGSMPVQKLKNHEDQIGLLFDSVAELRNKIIAELFAIGFTYQEISFVLSKFAKFFLISRESIGIISRRRKK